jgi:two-component system cell cycle sensor histidine kinase/response regulator CckA
MTSNDRSRNGCRVWAVVLTVLLGCVRVSAGTGDSLWREGEHSFAWVGSSPMSSIYGLCAIGSTVVAAAAVCWGLRWRRHALRHGNDHVLQQIAERSSSQQEVADAKQALQNLRESHELSLRQERLTAVGNLTAGLAHEFNNIMTIVQGHTSLLMANPKLDGESVKSLAHISAGVERMAELIRHMLAFSRKQVMQAEALDVRETLGGTLELLEQVLDRQAALRVDIAPHLPPILADWEMFEQILVNLVVNGRDAMGSGGQLTVTAAEASFRAEEIAGQFERRAGRFVRVSVTDTGSGMDRATIDHLFEPFFTTKEVGQGTGLGLAAVYGMVQQHQGWIEVESKLGLGTTFHVYFPTTDQAPQVAVEAASPPQVRGGQETVLVVEDESVLRELVREVLTAQGYSLLEAEDGVAALNVWEIHRDKVDLLLTDIAMPRGVSGRDLAERLRKEAPQLPVIFSSGYSLEMIERNDDAVRGATYLSKPYRPAQLAKAVREALDAAQERDAVVAAPVS